MHENKQPLLEYLAIQKYSYFNCNLSDSHSIDGKKENKGNSSIGKNSDG
jgi:hypothetical protein